MTQLADTTSLELKRFDLQIIASWIKPDSKVLDLGCGEGDLLLYFGLVISDIPVQGHGQVHEKK